MKIYWKKLIISLFVSFLPGIIGSLSMAGAIDGWYATLNKPWFTPPNWVFGPVWTILYALMGISLYLVWTSKTNVFRKTTAFSVFGIQLILNGLWTPVFFAVHSIALGFLVIVALDFSVVATIHLFYDLEKRTWYLLVPYVFWLCIATLLNGFILLLN